MAEIAVAWVQIVPSARGVQAQLERELEPAAKRSGERAGKGFADRFEASSGRSLKDFGKSALIGAAAFGVGLLGVTKAAGNLEAALAANEQVLGTASKGFQDFAKAGVENVGLSERAVLQAGTAFGQLGKVAKLTGDDIGVFAVDMVTLAADLAAFADVPADQAVNDLRAAFAGSTETMQKYNVFLNETELKSALFRATGEKVTGVLTSQQRVLATHAALMEQTGDIQGQAAREAGGFQRATDNLKATLENAAASIGTTTLPAVTGLIGGLTAGVGAAADLNDATGGLIGGLLLVGTTALGAGGSLALAADKASKAVSGFKAMSSTMQTVSIATAGVAAAAVAGFLIYDRWRQKQQQMRARTDEVAAALADQVRETLATAEASAGASGEIDGLAVAQRALANALTTGDDGERLTEALGALGFAASDGLDVLTRLGRDGGAALREIGVESGLTADQSEALAQSLTLSLGAGVDYANSVGVDWNDTMKNSRAALGELLDQVDRNDLDAMADSFLNTQAAGAGLTDEVQVLVSGLVDQAKAAATTADGTYDALAAYEAYGVILAELDPAQRDLIYGTEEIAAGMDTAATATTGFEKAAASSLSVMTKAERGFERAADQASAFSSAIDRLIGTQIDLQAAGDDLLDGFSDLSQVVLDTANGVDGASTSLDQFSEAGRTNRDIVRQQAERILSYSQGMLEAGSSIDEASAAALANTDQLKAQLVAFGLTEAEAASYIAELGLTPESIATAVELYNDEAAKQRVEELIDRLDEIPAEKRVEIQALIDEGAYAEAELALAKLERSRYTPIVPFRAPGGGSTRLARGAAWIDQPTAAVFGEAGPETVLPHDDPRRMQEILSDPRVFGSVVSSLPRLDRPATSDSGQRIGMLVEHQVIEAGIDLDTMHRIANQNLVQMGAA